MTTLGFGRIFILFIVVLMTVTRAQAESEQGKLNIYNWAGYTPPEVVTRFEQKTGIDVTVDVYDSNETLLAKLQAGGSGYDIIVTSHAFSEILRKEDLIQRFNPKELGNYANLKKRFVKPPWDPKGKYTLPYQWGTTSFAVDTAVYSESIKSYKTLFDPPASLRGEIGMFDTSSDLLQIAELYLGVPLCSEDPAKMQKVLELLLNQKPFVEVYSTAAKMRGLMVAGEIAMASNYSGQVKRMRDEKSSIKYVYPKEGVLTWVDVLSIPTTAANFENARKFANFLLVPENAAALSNHAGYSNGVVGSKKFMDADLVDAREINVPEGVKTVTMESCSPAASELAARIMTRLRQ